mgnify:CR=1 FL=1|tara:strand:- start:2091 stop:2354 length:264 start_codon:yes stop_codon:yes gene_type:complete
MITIQAKTLKALLKEIGAKPSAGKSLSVRTDRTYVGRSDTGTKYYEFGDAISHIKPLTDAQLAQIESLNEWVRVQQYKDHGFTIVRY